MKWIPPLQVRKAKGYDVLVLRLGVGMRRREFFTLFGGMAAWPLAAYAQPVERVRRVGVLMPFTANDPEAQARRVIFEKSLGQLGWTVGRDLQIEYRSAGGEAASIRKHAAELVALAPDVVMSVGSATIAPVQQASGTIP